LKQKLPRRDTKIEVLIASHADHDHIGGVPVVLTRYSVESLIMTSQTKESDDFGLFVESVQKAREKGTKIIGSRQGLGIQLAPDMVIRLLSPEMDQAIPSVLKTGSPETHLSAYFDDPTSSDIATNDGSIAVLVEYGNFTFLSTADLEERGEQTLIQGGLIKDIDVLKVGHHGSKTSTTDPFIDIIRPEFSLISCGQDNRYGHPHAEVLRRLGEINSAVLRTDQLGSIELQTNGQEYWFFLTQ
jgi:competence protein ComEC